MTATIYTGWTFPLHLYPDNVDELWEMAERLRQSEYPPTAAAAASLPWHDAFRLAVELYAAQKVAHSNEMVQTELRLRLEELTEAVKSIADKDDAA